MGNEQTTRPPGWYPDPDDPQVLRRFDGERWTDEHRPRPRFQKADGDAVAGPVPGPPSGPDTGTGSEDEDRADRKHWRWLAAGAVLMAVLVIGAFQFLQVPGAGPRTLSPAANAFTAAVGPDCTKTLPGLWPDFNADLTSEQLAIKTRQVADGLDGLVSRMRAEPALAALPDTDRAQIVSWLDQWGVFSAQGRAYAGALDAKDAKTQRRIDQESGALQQRIDRFGRANGLFDAGCKLFHPPPQSSGGGGFQ